LAVKRLRALHDRRGRKGGGWERVRWGRGGNGVGKMGRKGGKEWSFARHF